MIDAITRTDNMMASLGLEVYRVGGSVRDEVIGRTPKDADYMVRGISLSDLKNRLRLAKIGFGPLNDRDNRPLGVRLAKGGVEITLPRKEISTGPGHRDFNIVLDPTLPLAEDAKRRDFTFNALYKDLKAVPGEDFEIIDPTGRGLFDLSHRFICTTHESSFRDDPLRILRALRFMATLGYDLAGNTVRQMTEHAGAVDGLTDKGVSGTVLDEFSRLLSGPNAPKALRMAVSTGVLATAMPELADMIGFEQESKYHDLTTDEHTFKALETACHVDAPLRVRWALLFHDSGKPHAAWRGKDGRLHYYEKEIEPGITKLDHVDVGERMWRQAAERMNVPKTLREDVATLIREHMVPCTSAIKPTKVRRMRVKFGDDMLSDLFLHRMCDLTGKGKPNKAHMVNIANAEKARQKAVAADVPKSVKDLAINGNDAKAAGVSGRQIGIILSQILDEVVVDPSAMKLSRDWQLSRIEPLRTYCPVA